MSLWQLDRDELAAILRVVADLGTARTVDDFARVAMEGLAELIPCIDVSYNEMNLGAGRVRWLVSPAKDVDLLAGYASVFERSMDQNPLVAHFARTGDTRSLMWSDFATLDEIRRTTLHREMFRHLGVDSQMAVTLPAPAGVVVGFAVNGDAAGFVERDRAVMNTLRPHLAHAYQAAMLRAELRAELPADLDPDAAGPAGRVVGALADADGVVGAVTGGAADLAGQTGIELAEGAPLPPAIRPGLRAAAAGYDPDTPAVRSTPSRISDEAEGVTTWHVPGPVAPHLVVVERGVDRAAGRLRDAGLSPRQVEVALRLSEGGTNAAIAARLGIAEGTVRKHLERIYRALDVTDRASAIVRIRGW
ncbi:MAG: LuxR C-terminal-related transcriptional regulator [Actinomycetota bacterium]